MPELPEVEILVRHLAPLLRGRKIHQVTVNRERVIAPTSRRALTAALRNSVITDLQRRGKYMLFSLRTANRKTLVVVGHLGMTGRMYLLRHQDSLPKHAAVVLDLGRANFVFEDTRYFGRFTLDDRAIAELGPEPLGAEFTPDYFAAALKRFSQAIKVKLLDQQLVAGVGNIYASEALFRAGISPRTPARKLTARQAKRLWKGIRETLAEAVEGGSTVPLSFAAGRGGLFYFGQAPETPDFYEERLRVYDRAGQSCPKCGNSIRRLVQSARSTYYCPHCQR
jgi:formamidopyrimidine-DNA glycosylase